MTDAISSPPGAGGGPTDTVRRPLVVSPHLAKRYARERRFRYLGLGSVATAGLILLIPRLGETAEATVPVTVQP